MVHQLFMKGFSNIYMYIIYLILILLLNRNEFKKIKIIKMK